MSDPSRRPGVGRLLLGFTLGWALVACSGEGGSAAGNQDQQAPLAVASAIGLGEPAPGNRYTVRAGAPVLLSSAGSDGRDGPILSFEWSGPDDIPLIERTTSSVVFYAPQQARRLEFRLVVTDSQGDHASDTVVIDVVAVGDADEFLQLNPGADADWLTLEASVPAALKLAAHSFPVSAELIVTETVTWPTRRNAVGSACGDPQTLEFQRLARMIELEGPEDAQTVRFKLPGFNSDTINSRYQHGGEGAGAYAYGGNIRELRLEQACVDDVQRALSFELIVMSGDVEVAILSRAAPGPWIVSGDQPLQLDVQELRAALGLESRASADNYYAMIDPAGQAGTLDGWLDQSCFRGRPASDSAHALYINNYDLGFGRDMFFCRDDGGNVYSYVVNYPGLQNALEHRGEFAVVAMEYSGYPDAADADKIVKFYAFVPDEVNGGFTRMTSMNFDGRGEKYLPGVCLGCHGGSVELPRLLASTSPDVDGALLPFDLDSFLYTDATERRLIDPDIVRSEVSPELLRRYSRESQQAQFRKLNAMVLATYPLAEPRFDAVRALVNGWYGSDDPAATALVGDFNGRFVPAAWGGQASLYADVFAQHCRACHTLRADLSKQFAGYDDFIASFTDAANGKLTRYVFERGAMPLARLTMDRFWSPFGGDEAPAETLRRHLQWVDYSLAPAVTPVATAARFSCPTPPLGEPWRMVLDGSGSVLADQFQWRLERRPPGADAARLIDSRKETAEILDAYVPGIYRVALEVTDLSGAVTEHREDCLVEDVQPAFALGGQTFNLATAGSFDLTALVMSWGNGRLQDGSATLDWSNGSLVDAGDNTVEYRFADAGQEIADSFELTVTDADGDAVTSEPVRIVRNAVVATAFSASRMGSGVDAVAVGWDGVAQAGVQYRLQRASARAGSVPVEQCFGAVVRDCADTGLQSNTDYTYTLTTLVDGVEVSAQSIQVYTNPRWSDIERLEDSPTLVEPNGEFNHGDCAGCHALAAADAAYIDSESFQPTQSYLRNCLENRRKVCADADADTGRVWWTTEQDPTLGLASGHAGGDEVSAIRDANGTALIELARRWRDADYAQ